ncbi:MAG: hypothetical protein K2Y18_09475 [Alphaproteobacteria bacterium]|jgi:hypothetical protein|nr:hypothetical protein [Alphaproteobacteria bacterium]
MTKYRLVLGAFSLCTLQTNAAEGHVPYDDAAYARTGVRKLHDKMIENKILTEAEVEENESAKAKLVEDINGANSRGDNEAANKALRELGNRIASDIKKIAKLTEATTINNK